MSRSYLVTALPLTKGGGISTETRAFFEEIPNERWFAPREAEKTKEEQDAEAEADAEADADEEYETIENAFEDGPLKEIESGKDLIDVCKQQ